MEDDSPFDWRFGHDFKLRPLTPGHPIAAGFPWEDAWLYAHNRPRARPGSIVVALTSEEQGEGLRERPVIVNWDIAEGRSMALVFDWGGRGSTSFYEWAYWRDAVTRWSTIPPG